MGESKLIIGLTGKIGSGKTFLANALVDRYGFVRLAFGDSLKKIVYECFGLDDRYKQEPVTQNHIDYLQAAIDKLNSILLSLGFDGLSTFELGTIQAIFVNRGTAYRKLLQYIGTEIFRARDSEFWTKLMFSRLINSNFDKIVIDDVRFTNEFKLVRMNGLFNSFIVRLVSDYNIDPDISNHASETEVDKIPYDIKLINKKDGVDNLVNELVSELSNRLISNT